MSETERLTRNINATADWLSGLVTGAITVFVLLWLAAGAIFLIRLAAGAII